MTPKLYKHNRMRDVAVEINWVDKDMGVSVMWWNIGNRHEPFCIGQSQLFPLDRWKWEDWNEYKYEYRKGYYDQDTYITNS